MHRPFRFAPPTPAATAVLRPRLLAPLARRFDLRLVTVEAGAGFGKTTLLAQALAENALAPCGRDAWLTCEPADSSPSTLLQALLRAIGETAPDNGAAPTVTDVCEVVWNAAPQHVCLVLDDAHHLEPGSAGEATLRQLLQALPENGHLVVAARRLPALGSSRLLVQGRALGLGETDLALVDPESADLAARHSAPIDVVRRAGGWPALAELHARLGTADARRFVWDEVIAPLPDAERDAFLLLVVAGATSAEALGAAIGRPVDGERLAALPLVATDDRGGLRPHPLWEELLRDQLQQGPALDARCSLADVLAEHGDNGDAFELLAASGSWQRALEVLFDACNDQRNPPWHDQLARWQRLIPAPLGSEPEVAYLRGMLERADDAWSELARASFEAALAGFRARGDEVREIVGLVRSAHIAWLRGDVPSLDEFHARGRVLADRGWPIDALIALNRAAAADVAGNPDEVLTAAERLVELEPRLRHLPGLFRVFAHLADGNPDRARVAAREAADAAVPVATAAGAGWASLAPALVAWVSGELAAALDASLVDPGPRQSLAERVPTMALGVVVAAHVGDRARARALLDEIDRLVPDVGERHLLAGFRAVAGAAAAVADDDEAAAAATLTELLDDRDLGPATAGRAVRWLPSLPYLFHPPSRSVIRSLPSGPARQRVVEVCDALLAARAGGAPTLPSGCPDADTLLTILPVALATELVVHIASHGVSSATTVARLAELAPDATRAALSRLAEDDRQSVARAARALLSNVPIPPSHTARVFVLGPTRLAIDGVPVNSPTLRRQRVRQLLCALVAHRELRRERLGALLWPDFDDAAVSANLRMTLSYVQALLEPERGRGHAPWFLQQDAGVLRLTGDHRLSVDAWELEAHLDAAAAAASSAAPSIELDHLMHALELWRGEYLDDVAGEEWAEPLRERLRSRFVSAAVRAGELLVAAGRPLEAVRTADAALAADGWSEPAHRLRVRAHVAAGDEDGARRAVESAARQLAELGVTLTWEAGPVAAR